MKKHSKSRFLKIELLPCDLLILAMVTFLSVHLSAQDGILTAKENKLAGMYGTGSEKDNLLDIARFNWGMVCFGNEEATKERTEKVLNKILKMNPDFKFVVRLWPTSNARRGGNQVKATFLDYLYDSKVKEEIRHQIKEQIHSVTDYISKPENVVGFCFKEELPAHFSDNVQQIIDDTKVPSTTQHFAAQYEKETGRQLKTLDDNVRRWWGGKFVEAMNDINAYIKEVSGGKPVYIYLMMGCYYTMDMHPEGKTLSQLNLIPCYFRELIKPGICDGLVLYPGPRWDFYVKLAQKNNWPFFSQLSYSGGMRLFSWPETLKMVNVDIPQNKGYFMFVWSDDPHEWNANPDGVEGNGRAAIPLKLRRIGEQLNVGNEIVKSNLTPVVYAHYDTEKDKEGFVAVNLLIRNTREKSWFPYHPDMAVLKNVRVKVTVPEDYVQTPSSITFGKYLEIGDIQGDDYKKISYWPYKSANTAPFGDSRAIIVEILCDNAPPVVEKFTASKTTWPVQMEFDVRKSGDVMQIAIPEDLPFGNRKTGLEIELRCVGDPCSHPAISLGYSLGKLMYDGCLRKGQTLLIHPDMKAILKDKDNPEGKDVSSLVYGKLISLGGNELNQMVYSDADQPSFNTKVRISFKLVNLGNATSPVKK